MSRTWTHEQPPRWDETKAALFSRIPEGVFDLKDPAVGDSLPGEWWRAEEGGKTIGFGWMDVTWGEAEVLVAVDPDHQNQGVGAWIFERLAEEAKKRDQAYLVNVVRDTHPDKESVESWLLYRAGFEEASEGRLVRKT